MIITIVDQQGIKFIIDTEKAHNSYSIRKAFKQALLLEGYTEKYVNQLFNQQTDDKEMEKETCRN
jgi:hypothetical protein